MDKITERVGNITPINYYKEDAWRAFNESSERVVLTEEQYRITLSNHDPEPDQHKED